MKPFLPVHIGPGLGISSSFFWVNRYFFAKKWAIHSKKQAICSFLVSDLSKLLTIASFLVIDLSDLLTVALLSWVTWAIRSHRSLKKRDWENRWFFKNNLLKKFLKIQFYSNFLKESLFFCKRISDSLKKTSDLLIHSFIMSPLSKSFTVALLSWVTWAICSQSLIFDEQSQQFAHCRSFVLSNLSEWAMSEWANSQPCMGPTSKIWEEKMVENLVTLSL